MNWDTYKSAFTAKAVEKGFYQSEITSWLEYAEVIQKNQLPIIFETTHLALLLGYKKSYLERAVTFTPFFYKSFVIPKKNGTSRTITEPLPSLKEIQNWILHEILNKCKISKYAKAYVKNRSIKGNARFHINKEVVLSVDLKDFFGSISVDMVDELFRSLGYSLEVSSILSRLCCLNGTLPQGAPTSPMLSNIVFLYLDESISKYALNNTINYTRYADDLTFSGSFRPGQVIKFITDLLINSPFRLNHDKTRSRRRNQRQEVTGIVVNSKMQAPKNVRREFKKNVYFIKKFGLSNHIQHEQIKRDNYLNHLIGIGNFIFFINSKDYSIKEDILLLCTLKNAI